MVVCKFFQQGSCRYGQNCRFDHIYGSKYSYHSNAPPPQAASTAPAVTDEQLVHQVQSDVQAVLRGGQWILSSYAPFKEKAAFPGIADLSPEEARLFIYEAKANNNVEQAVSYMNELFKDARLKYEQLLLKNTNIIRVFRSLYKGENVASPFGNVSQESSFGPNNDASSIFRSAVQPSPFTQNNQSTSIFNQNTTPSVFSPQNAAPSMFAQNNDMNSDPAKSIFAQANQNSFSNQTPNVFQGQSPINNSNIFGPQADSAKSIFAQAAQNVFALPPSNPPQSDPVDLFAKASQSIFTQNHQNTPFVQNQSNVFQSQEQNVFNRNQNVFQQASAGDMSIYSKMEDLSPEDIEAFNSNDFKMGFVPELPPPHSLV